MKRNPPNSKRTARPTTPSAPHFTKIDFVRPEQLLPVSSALIQKPIRSQTPIETPSNFDKALAQITV